MESFIIQFARVVLCSLVFLLRAAEAKEGRGIIFYEEGIPAAISLIRGLEEKKPQEKIKLALISSRSVSETMQMLRTFHLDNTFDAISFAQERDAYLLLTKSLGLSPSRCMSFAHSDFAVSSASSCGIACFYVSLERTENPSDACFLLRSFSEITLQELLHVGMQIHVYKSKRRLEVMQDNHLLLSFPIGIGKNSLGPKELEGDLKTPEGEYFVCFKNPDSKFYLSFAINYPNKEDAKRGLEKNLISTLQYEAICRAEEQRRPPPWDTALGGEIFIHGNFEEGDGSLGCVRMFEKDIELLYAITPLGTKVIICP